MRSVYPPARAFGSERTSESEIAGATVFTARPARDNGFERMRWPLGTVTKWFAH